MDPRIERGFKRHFEAIEKRIRGGETRLGFKVAFNPPAVQAKLGIPYSLLAGMTNATLHRGQPYALQGSTTTAVEAEVAAFLGADVSASADEATAAAAVEAFAPAIEVVERDRRPDELEEVLAEGVFHRRVALGPKQRPAPGASLAGLIASVQCNGVSVADVDAGQATGDVPKLLLHLASLLEHVGQRLCANDVVILGAMVTPVAPAAGDVFAVSLNAGAPATLHFT